ncbi:MAG: hypothetical protein ABI268_04560 [Rhodanobacter sp.]
MKPPSILGNSSRLNDGAALGKASAAWLLRSVGPAGQTRFSRVCHCLLETVMDGRKVLTELVLRERHGLAGPPHVLQGLVSHAAYGTC